MRRSVRAAAILTNSYVNGTVIGPVGNSTAFDPQEQNQLIIYVTLTLGSLTSASIRVEFSDDGTTYYRETEETIASGTATTTVLVHTMAATDNFRFAIPIQDKNIRISAIGTGTVTSSSMAIEVTLGNR